MSKTPIYDALLRYADENPLRLHMPGHMGKGDILRRFGELAKYDITELSATADLFHGEGAAKETLDNLDAFYGGTSVIFTTGASSAVKTAIALSCSAGGKILIERNFHRSALDAMILLNLSPEYFYFDDLQNALLTSEAETVFVTSPDYYGNILDIAAAAKAAHALGKKLIVDNSHGSHLAAYDKKLHPFFAGADFCIDSFHKTLPAFTGAALLHSRVKRSEVLSCAALFSSTSPNYIVAASAELAFEYLTGALSSDLARISKITAQYKENPEFSDPLRVALPFDFSADGVSTEGPGVLLFSPLFNEDDAARLESALPPKKYPKKIIEKTALPDTAVSLRQAFFSQCEILPLSHAAGKVAARPLYIYPPAIPLVLPGEIFSPEFCTRHQNEFETVTVIKNA